MSPKGAVEWPRDSSEEWTRDSSEEWTRDSSELDWTRDSSEEWTRDSSVEWTRDSSEVEWTCDSSEVEWTRDSSRACRLHRPQSLRVPSRRLRMKWRVRMCARACRAWHVVARGGVRAYLAVYTVSCLMSRWQVRDRLAQGLGGMHPHSTSARSHAWSTQA